MNKEQFAKETGALADVLAKATGKHFNTENFTQIQEEVIIAAFITTLVAFAKVFGCPPSILISGFLAKAGKLDGVKLHECNADELGGLDVESLMRDTGLSDRPATSVPVFDTGRPRSKLEIN